MKMSYRQEPIYPDDLKMITEIGLLKDMTGTMLFTVILAAAGTVIGLFAGTCFEAWKGRRFQLIRLTTLLVAIGLLGYISNFNNPDNLLRKHIIKRHYGYLTARKWTTITLVLSVGFVQSEGRTNGWTWRIFERKIKEITENTRS